MKTLLLTCVLHRMIVRMAAVVVTKCFVSLPSYCEARFLSTCLIVNLEKYKGLGSFLTKGEGSFLTKGEIAYQGKLSICISLYCSTLVMVVNYGCLLDNRSNASACQCIKV